VRERVGAPSQDKRAPPWRSPSQALASRAARNTGTATLPAGSPSSSVSADSGRPPRAQRSREPPLSPSALPERWRGRSASALPGARATDSLRCVAQPTPPASPPETPTAEAHAGVYHAGETSSQPRPKGTTWLLAQPGPRVLPCAIPTMRSGRSRSPCGDPRLRTLLGTPRPSPHPDHLVAPPGAPVDMTVGDQAQQAGRTRHAKRRVWHPPNDRAVALGLASLTTRHPILDAGNRAAGICMQLPGRHPRSAPASTGGCRHPAVDAGVAVE
jgi:hypothetical protein